MNNLERRIERLEETLDMKPGPRHIIITNVNFLEGEESPCEVEFLPGLYALAYGGPFTTEEIDKLREEYAEQRRSPRRCIN
jgi:hypothetical protein